SNQDLRSPCVLSVSSVYRAREINSALIATGPASHHATAWTRPVVQAELNQRGIRRGDGVGIAVQGARHCQDLLRVHDDQQAVAHNRPDLGGFFKISVDL